MADQFTDRAYEACSVTGTGNVACNGPKVGFVVVPEGESTCLIEGILARESSGQWEVVQGTKTGSTFVRNTVIASSNGGLKVNFTDPTEITVVASSAHFENIEAQVAQNVTDIFNNAAVIAQNVTDIFDNATDIGNNTSAILANATQIALNLTQINTNTTDIATKLTNPMVETLDANGNSIINASNLTLENGQPVTWNVGDRTLDIPSGLGNTIQAGQELSLIVRNDTGTLIPNGSVVSILPIPLTNTRPSVGLAQADTHWSLLTALFIATTDIPIAGEGFVTKFGMVRGFDTSDFAAGDIVWLSPTVAGGLTNVPPEFPNYRAGLAQIITSHESTGSLFCDVVTDLDDTFRNFFNGMFREQFTFSVSSADGITVIGTLSPTGINPDMTMIFSDGFSTFDTSPPYEIIMTPGTDLAPATRYIYILQSTKLMVEGSGWPAEEHIKIAIVSLRSAQTTKDNGTVNENIDDALMDNGQGHLLHITQRLRKEGTAWESGAEGLATIIDVSTPDDVFVSVTGGKVYQLHLQDFQSFDQQVGDLVHILNHPTAPFSGVTNLNTQIVDAQNVTLNNTSFSFVLWGAVNSVDDSHLLLNLPTGSYAFTAPADAIADPNNYSVYSIPPQFIGSGFLIARFTFTYKNDVWTLEATEDLRGSKPNTSAGGGVGGSGVTTFLGLTDVFNSYLDLGGLYPKINVGETGLEAYDIDADIASLQAQVDTKATKAYADQQAIIMAIALG